MKRSAALVLLALTLTPGVPALAQSDALPFTVGNIRVEGRARSSHRG